MADINLLPEEFRSKDNKERIDAKKQSKKTELHLTSPAKSKDITTKKGFWNKIFPGGGGIQAPKKEVKNEIKLEPAKKKVKHLKSVSLDNVHIPDKAIEKDVKPEVLEVEKKVVEEKAPVRKPPINPHLSDFQKPPEPKKAEEKDGPNLHMPSNGKNEAKADTPKSVETTPKIIFDKPGGESETEQGILGKVVEGIKNVFYKIIKRKDHSRIAVNLMPEHRISLKDINWSRIVRMLITSVGGAAGITVIWYLVLLDQERKGQVALSDLRNEISSLQIEISQLREDQKGALLLKNKLDVAGSLLDEHVYWSNFLALLESLTLDGVYYNNFDAVLNGSEPVPIFLDGTSDSLEAVFWQRETFRGSEFITNAEVADVVSNTSEDGETTINFTIEIVVEPIAWNK